MTTLTDFARAKHLLNSHHGYTLEAAIADAFAAERERYAKIADTYADRCKEGGPLSSMAEDRWGEVAARNLAARIRAVR